MSKKLTIEKVRKSFELEGYTFLTEKYINNSQKLEYICPNGHRHSISWRDWNSKGVRCPYCAGRPPITIDIVRDSMAKEKYILLTDNYINNKQPLVCMCPNGHRYTTNWAKWYSHGYRCSHCYGNAKKDIDNISSVFCGAGYQLKTTEYKNCNQKLHLICPNGHDYYVSWDNWNHSGSRCPKCSTKGTSVEEYKLYEFIKDIYFDKVFSNSYDVITPKELDIVIPSKKIAIEYCGLYWHSELLGKSKNYHLDKLKLCNKEGYRLITVFSDEFINNKDIVFSRLKNILNTGDLNIIYARNCKIKEISIQQSRLFCDTNHLQGYHGSAIKLGAFYNDELVSVMTFAKPSIAKGSRIYKEGVWELSRFCSKLDYSVVGIASKLLKYFERNYDWNKIFSYADRRWSEGNLYEKLGFEFDSITKPSYWYLIGKCDRRIHRFALRKTKEDPKDQTEWQIRMSQGYNRIWDCGNLKYVRINNNI